MEKEHIGFAVWLEFEEGDPDNWDKFDELANIQVDLADGRKYGINVWTYKFLETLISLDKKSGEKLSGLYQCPPDLLVEELTRECITNSIEDLLKKGNLEDFLNPGIIINEKS